MLAVLYNVHRSAQHKERVTCSVTTVRQVRSAILTVSTCERCLALPPTNLGSTCKTWNEHARHATTEVPAAQASSMAGTIIGVLADVNCFYAYDSRESLAAQAEQGF